MRWFVYTDQMSEDENNLVISINSKDINIAAAVNINLPKEIKALPLAQRV